MVDQPGLKCHSLTTQPYIIIRSERTELRHYIWYFFAISKSNFCHIEAMWMGSKSVKCPFWLTGRIPQSLCWMETLVWVAVERRMALRFVGWMSLLSSSAYFAQFYLLAGYYYTATQEYDIKWTMPQCVLTLKLIGEFWLRLQFENSAGAFLTPSCHFEAFGWWSH